MRTYGPGGVSSGPWQLKYHKDDIDNWQVVQPYEWEPGKTAFGFVASFERYEDARYVTNCRNRHWASTFPADEADIVYYPKTEEEYHEERAV